jgi:hypothetical protein
MTAPRQPLHEAAGRVVEAAGDLAELAAAVEDLRRVLDPAHGDQTVELYPDQVGDAAHWLVRLEELLRFVELDRQAVELLRSGYTFTGPVNAEQARLADEIGQLAVALGRLAPRGGESA